MADQTRRGFGFAEVLLIGVALCVMTAVGIATASAFTQTPSSPDASPVATPVTQQTLEPIAPEAETIAPPTQKAEGDQGAQVSAEWMRDISARTGIGTVALQAYGAATLRLAEEQPACRLGWTTLAGIGGIESGHGTNGGATLLEDGTTSQRILGPALDGTQGFAAIRSTEESIAWHGDEQWDHAVGPMQFIPSTWDRWQSDGNDDGVSDPNNVFDAAYAAARYLCASGADLRTGSGWSQAVFSYNHSNDYVRSVLAFANHYGKS